MTLVTRELTRPHQPGQRAAGDSAAGEVIQDVPCARLAHSLSEGENRKAVAVLTAWRTGWIPPLSAGTVVSLPYAGRHHFRRQLAVTGREVVHHPMDERANGRVRVTDHQGE